MSRRGTLVMLLALVITMTGIGYLAISQHDQADAWEQRKPRLLQAARSAQPLIDAIGAWIARTGQPPDSLADIIPGDLATLPDTGTAECDRFEYRSLLHKQGSIVWYDLGSRQGAPPGGMRYSDGNPDHAILVFTLDSSHRIGSAVIDRLPRDREPVEFDPQRWRNGGDRIGMALAFAETYRLYGMPRQVLEQLLGTPDGSRNVRGTPWELRASCPTGLLNHDSFVYWPDGNYPPRLYGGVTVPVGDWVYVRSAPLLR